MTSRHTLTPQQRQEILEMYDSGQYLNSVIAAKYGLKRVSIKDVIKIARKAAQSPTDKITGGD